MQYEVIREIENSCKLNQLRDVFVEELDIPDPDAWIREKEPRAGKVTKEVRPNGLRYIVNTAGQLTFYILTEID